MDLGSAFSVSVRRRPDAEAVVDGDRRRLYVGGALGDVLAGAGRPAMFCLEDFVKVE